MAEASGYLFTSLHNLRVDRSSSYRDLLSDKPPTGVSQMLREVRAAEMTALKAGRLSLKKIVSLQGNADVAALDEAVKKLAALHEESAVALTQPKAARRAGIADDALNQTTKLYDILDKLSTQLANSVRLNDAFIDKLIELKQLAWVARNSGGDAHVLISNAVGGLPLAADIIQKYSTHMTASRTAWAVLEEFSRGLAMPERFTQAVQRANKEFYAPEFSEYRLAILKKVLAGEKVGITAPDWLKKSVSSLATQLDVAYVCLDLAKEPVGNLRKRIIELPAHLGLVVTGEPPMPDMPYDPHNLEGIVPVSLARAWNTKPTGFSAVPPVGPATPVTPRPKVVAQRLRMPSASAAAVSPLTAPCFLINSADTPASAVLSWSE